MNRVERGGKRRDRVRGGGRGEEEVVGMSC